MGKFSIFIDNADGIVLSQTGELSAVDVMEKFQQYLNLFNTSYVNEK
jgi:hypothetical protein